MGRNNMFGHGQQGKRAEPKQDRRDASDEIVESSYRRRSQIIGKEACGRVTKNAKAGDLPTRKNGQLHTSTRQIGATLEGNAQQMTYGHTLPNVPGITVGFVAITDVETIRNLTNAVTSSEQQTLLAHVLQRVLPVIRDPPRRTTIRRRNMCKS